MEHQLSFFKDKPKGNILGLDLSLRSSGYAIIDYLTGDVLKIGKILTDKSMTDEETIIYIAQQIIELSKNYNVEFIARETTFVKHKGTAVRLSLLGGSFITTSLLIIKASRLEGYAPSQIKKNITGKGNCKKEDVAWQLQKTYPMLVEQYPFSTKQLKRQKIEKTDDLYDALGAAVSLRRDLLQDITE